MYRSLCIRWAYGDLGIGRDHNSRVLLPNLQSSDESQTSHLLAATSFWVTVVTVILAMPEMMRLTSPTWRDQEKVIDLIVHLALSDHERLLRSGSCVTSLSFV